jgi:hypothetical protein
VSDQQHDADQVEDPHENAQRAQELNHGRRLCYCCYCCCCCCCEGGCCQVCLFCFCFVVVEWIKFWVSWNKRKNEQNWRIKLGLFYTNLVLIQT